MPTTVPLFVDGQKSALEKPLYWDEQGRLLIAASDAALLLGCQLELADSNQLELIRAGSILSQRVGLNQVLWEEELTDIPSPPQMIDEVIYVPLRSSAELFGFTVVYDAARGGLWLYSPGTPVPQLAAAADPPPHLPAWGRIADAAGLEDLWPGEALIGSYYTTLIDSPAGRSQNVELSCIAINETVLEAGQVFSFNQAVGPRSAQRGYQVAPIFVGQKVVPGLGGGICQTSSTLYNAVLDSGLEVVQRHRHSLPVAYVAPQRDATVSWGGADFQFRNTYDAPVKVLARVWGKYVLCAIAEVR